MESVESGSEHHHALVKLSIDPSTSSPLLGFCTINTLTRTISIGQCHDTEAYANLSHILLLTPAASLTLGVDTVKLNAATVDKVKRIVTSLGFTPQLLKYAEFKKADDALADLQKLVKHPAQLLTVRDWAEGLGACGAGIRALQLLQDELHRGKWQVSAFALSDFMLIDTAAAAALNVFPQPDSTDKNASLYGLLNKGRTKMGDRKLRQWLKQPLLSLPLIQRRQRLLAMFVDAPAAFRAEIRDVHLGHMPNYHTVIRAFQTGRAGLQQIMQLWQAIGRLPRLIDHLSDYDGPHRPLMLSTFVEPMAAALTSFDVLDRMVQQTIDLNPSTGFEYALNVRAIPELKVRRDEVDAVMKDMLHEKAGLEATLDLHDAITLRESGTSAGWVLRVNSNNEKQLRGHRSVQVVTTNKQGCSFTTPRLKFLNKRHAEVSEAYTREESQYVQQAVATVATYTHVLEDLSELYAELDVLVGWAHVCLTAGAGYVEPEMLPMDTGVIEMVQARHPCLEVMDGVNFIPNDVLLRRGDSHLQIITGPNMGGKSTYIRQTGTNQLLAQIGMRLPCKSARLSVCDRILARVGAGDVALKGVSTYMKEMIEATAILASATRNSLIIIDELGRGTSTYDGLGVAWAIAEHIAHVIQSYCLISTHFHELAALDRQPGIRNKHVVVSVEGRQDDQQDEHEGGAVEEGGIVMTHHVADGPSGKSFGINVAVMARLPAEVIAYARQRVRQLEDNARNLGDDSQHDDEKDQVADGGVLTPAEVTEVSQALLRLKALNATGEECQQLWDKELDALSAGARKKVEAYCTAPST